MIKPASKFLVSTLAGASAAVLVLPGVLLAGAEDERARQNDPFSEEGGSRKLVERQLSIFVEFIRLDHAELSTLMRLHSPARDKTALRRTLQSMIEDGRADLIETIWMRAAGDGDRRTVKSCTELIYPTEGDPPEVPEQLSLNGVAPADFHGTSQSSTAFETRDVGARLEIYPMLGPKGEWIDLGFTLEYHEEPLILHHQSEDDADSEIKNRWMPIFRAFYVTTSLALKDGSWAIVGIHTPRGDDSKRVVALIRASVLK
jgi:hypothetical protein